MRAGFTVMFLMSLSIATIAESANLEAAVGGGLGGAAGAAIGNELGGRDGAIIGGALGGGFGAAVTTPEDKKKVDRRRSVNDHERYYGKPTGYPHYHFCPPGQAKKGRC